MTSEQSRKIQESKVKKKHVLWQVEHVSMCYIRELNKPTTIGAVISDPGFQRWG
jgi:hypothetical protein